MRARSLLLCALGVFLFLLPHRAHPQEEQPQTAPASLPALPQKTAPSPAPPNTTTPAPEREEPALRPTPPPKPPKKKNPRLLYAGGYLALNLGLFAGLHAIHAGLEVKELQETGGSLEEIAESAEHAHIDALIADVLFAAGFLSLGAGYIKDQHARGEPVLSPRLFYATSVFSGVAGLGAMGLSQVFKGRAEEGGAPLAARRLSRVGGAALLISLASGGTGFLLSRVRQKKELQVGVGPGGVSLAVSF